MWQCNNVFDESRVISALFSCPEGGGHLHPISSAFLEAVKADARKYYWMGRITTTDGAVYGFDIAGEELHQHKVLDIDTRG